MLREAAAAAVFICGSFCTEPAALWARLHAHILSRPSDHARILLAVRKEKKQGGSARGWQGQGQGQASG